VKGENEQQVLQKNEAILKTLEQKKKEGLIGKFLSPSLLLVSDSLQHERINKWNTFWNEDRKKSALNTLEQEGQALKFSQAVYANFKSFIDRTYEPLDIETKVELKQSFFNESIISTNNQVTIITPVSVKPELKNQFYASVETYPGVRTLDRQSLTNNFIEKVNADFTFIVMFTSLLVFGALLLAYGRIELALITFVPMFVTWIWILGIMALLKIEFNIVNVMVSTFIFGLGDDYSIFTMDGLQQRYKTGRKNISSVRISIFISAVTTTVGLGVLFFAKHPALQSIALISITGMRRVVMRHGNGHGRSGPERLKLMN
jgi:predicted RND superfamily exporter protein